MLKNDWTKEDRYRPYKEWDDNYINLLQKEIANSKWRLAYHIQPNTGLLNDPNGFTFYNNQWHLFYQSYPMGAVHGVKSWYHLTSTNLVDWKEDGIKLFPDTIYDSHGVYSGTALPISDKLFIAYTGNVRNTDWARHSYQLGAWMNRYGQVKKISEPLIYSPPNGYTSEFRDPQVFSYEDKYLMIIGAQDESQNGQVLVYQSCDLLSWDFKGELNFTNKEMGFMIECPNLLLTEDAALLIFCPQGLKKDICDYKNIYPNSYIVGDSYDFDSNSIINPSKLKNLDEGFDVYATQAFKSPDKRLLSISWVGLPEIAYPTDHEGWAHCLSSVKELVIQDKKLYQKPVKEMEELREGEAFHFDQSSASFIKLDSNRYEMAVTFDKLASGSLSLYTDKDKKNGLHINFDSQRGKMTIDRSNSGVIFGEKHGSVRAFSIEQKPLTLQIFVDSSVVEVFINDGETVATMRVFPNSEQTGFHIIYDGRYQGELWKIRKTSL